MENVNSENCERNSNVSSFTQFPALQFTQLSCVLFPGLHFWSYLGCYKLFMCSFQFWSITWSEILLPSMLKVSSKECHSWLWWCNLSVSHEVRLQSENHTRKQLTAALLLLVCNDMKFFYFFLFFPWVLKVSVRSLSNN